MKPPFWLQNKAAKVTQLRILCNRAAFAAQDGQESLPLPEEADWVFIAGSTEWKLSDGQPA